MISPSSTKWNHLRFARLRAERVLLSLLVTAVMAAAAGPVLANAERGYGPEGGPYELTRYGYLCPKQPQFRVRA